MDTTDQGFVAQWQRVAPILVNVERLRLREYSDADRQSDIEALLALSIAPTLSSTPTGLIEQQRLFQRQSQ